MARRRVIQGPPTNEALRLLREIDESLDTLCQMVYDERQTLGEAEGSAPELDEALRRLDRRIGVV